MDDFLHNLRSGKLKQADRGNRNYNDPQYKGAQRRNMMERRNKRDFDTKESFERLNAIKEVLESLSQTQKRMALAYEARTRAEERKARAMEILAKNLYRMLNPEASDADQLFAFPDPALIPAQTDGADSLESDRADRKTAHAADEPSHAQDAAEESENDNRNDNQKLSEDDRQAIVQLTSDLRDEGQSWEKIARHIAAQGYPTISGKGTWRGVMVKNLYEKVESEQFNR